MGVLSAFFGVTDPKSIDSRLGRRTRSQGDARMQTTGISRSWLEGARPSDTVLDALEGPTLGADIRRMRDLPIWPLLDTDGGDVARLAEEVIRGSPDPMRRLMEGTGVKFGGEKSRKRLPISQLVIQSLRGYDSLLDFDAPDLENLTRLVACARLGEVLERNDLRITASLHSFGVAARLVAAEPVFARSHRAFYTALSNALFQRISAGGMEFAVTRSDFDEAVAAARSEDQTAGTAVETFLALRRLLSSPEAKGDGLAKLVPDQMDAPKFWTKCAALIRSENCDGVYAARRIGREWSDSRKEPVMRQPRRAGGSALQLYATL